MSEEYDQIWKTIRASLNMTASEFVPKLYETLTKQDGYSPKDARDKIKRDATNIWKADTIDRHIPEEAKQMIKVTAGQQKGKTKTEIEKDEVPNKDSAGLNPAQYKPSSAMEEFRKQHGTKVEDPDPSKGWTAEIPEQQEDDTIKYDPQFVDRLVKENAEYKDLIQNLKKERVEASMSKSYTSEYPLEFSDDDLSTIKSNAGVCPLIITSYPEKKHSIARFDRLGLQNKKKK